MLSGNFSTKVYLLVTLLVTGIMTSAASYFLIAQNHALNDAMTQQAKSLSISLAEGARVGVILEDRGFIEQVASGLLGLPHLLFIDVYLNDRRALAHMGDTDHQLILSEEPFKIAARSGFFAGEEIVDQKMTAPYRNFMTPILLDNHEVAGFVRLGFSTADIIRKQHQSLITTVWVTLLLIIVACLVVYLPVKRMTRPLEQLSEGAVRIGRGDLGFEITVNSKDEIGQLAHDFNAMSESLRQQTHEINMKTDELQHSERKFRELFENIAQPLYINDLEGKLIDCNQAMVDLFGYESRKDMVDTIKSGGFIFLHSEQRQHTIEKLIEHGEVKGLEVEYKKKDNTPVKALLTSRVRINEDGEVIGFEGMIQDITELRLLEEQLLHSQKMESIGTLAGGIAHDFNNLLAAIMLSAELAKVKKDDAELVEKYIDRISGATQRAAELTRNLLGFARKGKMRIEDIDTGELVSEVEALLRETIDRSIRLYTDISPDLCSVRGNPSQIHQILMNLCINAKDAILSADGHELKISVRNCDIDQAFVDHHPDAICGSYVLIDVTDDGSGIPEDIKNQIFDPFFTTKGVGEGTGLGLATVYGIIKNHDGFLYLESEDGKGTTFHVYLPAAPTVVEHVGFANEVEVVPEPLHVESAIMAENHTVLFVDDEEVLREIAFEFLTSCGYNILIASNGEEALEILVDEHQNISLAILDLMMPKMGGEETLKNMKHKYPDIPVIIASGYSSESLNQKMSFQQYDGYIEKPYLLADLELTVEKALRGGFSS